MAVERPAKACAAGVKGLNSRQRVLHAVFQDSEDSFTCDLQQFKWPKAGQLGGSRRLGDWNNPRGTPLVRNDREANTGGVKKAHPSA